MAGESCWDRVTCWHVGNTSPELGGGSGPLLTGTPTRALPTRTLQAASFITPIWAVLFLVAAFGHKDTSPIPTGELILTTGPWCY